MKNIEKAYTIGIVGNPNSGKTSVFNLLIGGKHKVGNWPGVTVERKGGRYRFNGRKVLVTDLPGIYSLSGASRDEDVTTHFILSEKPDLIVNIIDGAHLERNLYLTMQLIEMRIPLLIVVTMMDMVKNQNVRLRLDVLSRMLDCPLVGVVASKKDAGEEVRLAIDDALTTQRIPQAQIYFPNEIERVIDNVIMHLKTGSQEQHIHNMRWLATKLLEDDLDGDQSGTFEISKDDIGNEKNRIKTVLGNDVDIIIAESRYGFIKSLCKKVVDRSNIIRKTISDSIDTIALNKYLGLPLFFGIMLMVFWITIQIGGCFIDFFDHIGKSIFVDGMSIVLSSMHAPHAVITFFTQAIGKSIQLIGTFIPPIFFMFLCLAVLEDSGYMARAAFIMDNSMRKVGLPGKAFIPVLIGFGCNVPAIMATRTLEDARDRKIAILMNPFMSCGARLPVYALFAVAFFPDNGGMIIFLLYLIGIVVGLITAKLAASFLKKGEVSAFLMELPSYHIPTIKGIFIHTWDRLRSFILRAGKIIVIIGVLIHLVNMFTMTQNDAEHNSALSKLGKRIVFVFNPIGITKQNWPAAVGILVGVLHKEAVIGTLNTLYAADEENTDGFTPRAITYTEVGHGIKYAFMSIPQKFSKLSLPFIMRKRAHEPPVLLDDFNVSRDVYSELRTHFNGKIGAFAYLLLVLLYMPCVAAIATIYRELNLKWAVVSVVYATIVAWSVAVLFYNVGTFFIQPVMSVIWISVALMLFFVMYYYLRIQLSVEKVRQ